MLLFLLFLLLVISWESLSYCFSSYFLKSYSWAESRIASHTRTGIKLEFSFITRRDVSELISRCVWINYFWFFIYGRQTILQLLLFPSSIKCWTFHYFLLVLTWNMQQKYNKFYSQWMGQNTVYKLWKIFWLTTLNWNSIHVNVCTN